MIGFLRSSNIGIELMKTGKFDLAVEYFSAAIKNNPKDSDAYFNLAKAYFKFSDYRNTKLNLMAALKLNAKEEMRRNILEITNWRILSSNTYFNSNPAFSPDGNWIACISVRHDTNGDNKLNMYDCTGIYITDTKGTEEYYIVSDEY